MKTAPLFVWTLAMLTLCAVAADAQVVPNPTTLVFTASADHSALGLDDQPLVTGYELRIFLNGVIVATYALGKPTPAADGTVTMLDPTWFSPLLANKKHVARVVAIGPTGAGESESSNFFGRTGPPAPPSGVAVTRSGGGGDGSGVR